MSIPRVLLADARPTRARRLGATLSEQGTLKVEAVAQTLMEAYNLTESLSPEAVAVSAEMATQPEYPMFRALLEAMRIRHVVYGTAVPTDLPAAARSHFVTLAEEAEAKPILARLAGAAPAAPAVGEAESARGGRLPLVVMGASTGGIEALEEVLSEFPAGGPPVLIVQHIRGEFSAAIAARLDRAGAVSVQEARDGAPILPGHVYIAPGNDLHLEVTGRQALRCRLRPGPPVSGHRPSIDVLFRSAAMLGPQVVGALLTGMGRDGAEGLLEIRRAGGITFAQDRDSCVVHGMPRVACEIGAVDRELPLRRIAGAVLAASTELRRGQSEVGAR